MKRSVIMHLVIVFLVGISPAGGMSSVRHMQTRLIIMADMGNEPDEEQQMTHMLSCSGRPEQKRIRTVV